MATPLPKNEAAAPSPSPSSNKTPTGTPKKIANPSQNVMSQYDQLIDLLHNLPRELFDQIQTTTLELALCPGHIFPQQRTAGQETHWNGRTHFIARPELLRLSKAIYKENHPRYWSENTFVIGTAPAPHSLAWLDELPSTTTQRISKMHLTFTSDDSEKDWKVFLARDRRRFHTHEVMDVDSKSPTIADWIDKVLRIRELSLRELTLDVSKSGDMFQDCWIKWLVASSTVCFTSGTLPAVRVVTGNRYDDERMVEFLLWCKEERKKRESAIG